MSFSRKKKKKFRRKEKKNSLSISLSPPLSSSLTPVKKNTIELATNDSASQKASNAP